MPKISLHRPFCQMVLKISFPGEKSEHDGRHHFVGVNFALFVSGRICVEVLMKGTEVLMKYCNRTLSHQNNVEYLHATKNKTKQNKTKNCA